jgi:hypothetical protein
MRPFYHQDPLKGTFWPGLDILIPVASLTKSDLETKSAKSGKLTSLFVFVISHKNEGQKNH